MAMAPAARPPRTASVASALCLLLQTAVLGAADETCSASGGPGCSERKHFWPRARGQQPQYSVTNLTGPRDLSKPWYTWFPGETRFHSVTLGGPLIDDQKNLYVTGVRGIYKLTTDGHLIWHFPCPFAPISDCPSLSPDGRLFGTCASGHAFALDIETGRAIWMQRHGEGSGDTGYVENHDGVVLFEMDGQNERCVAVNASDGSKLWEFRPDVSFWNFMALFPGDGTVLFQDMDAKVYRLGLHNGTLLWKAGGGHTLQPTWSDGGAMIGPNGLVYAASAKAGTVSHHPTAGGGVHAYKVDTGELVWQKHLLRPFFSWPAIGKLPGRDGYSVIVSLGANAYFPWMSILYGKLEGLLQVSAWTMVPVAVWVLVQLRRLSKGKFFTRSGLVWASLQLVLLAVVVLFEPLCATYLYTQGQGTLPIATFEAEIYAYDADTGEQQWVYHLPPWPYVSAAGDAEGQMLRNRVLPERGACLPAAYSAPTIDASGTVWVGYMSGAVLGLRDENGDGVVTESEARVFDTKGAFLHSGPAFAPGIMAITNCDTMWVWKI